MYTRTEECNLCDFCIYIYFIIKLVVKYKDKFIANTVINNESQFYS